MNPDTLTLFREVANRPPSEREEYYTQNQISDALRSEVEGLLQAGERTVDSLAGHLASAAVRAILEEPSASQAPPEPPAARPMLQPEVIGRYRVIRLLGRGGMSDVYLARDPMLERDLAIKLIAGGMDDEVARRRLVREASASGRLRHPNIVTIFDAGEFEGRPFIAMEYVPGQTMRSIVQKRLDLPLRRRLELIEHACAGLAHAHGLGVVHLDIKPDNLIVDESGVLKVLDFGIARILTSESLATRHILGTLRYMSPEQVAGDPLDHRSDIFSLGCSLYELLAYVPAYSGSTREIVYRIAVGPVPRLIEVMPDIDPRLDAAIGRAMALDPAERFADLDEFQAELARLRAELDPTGVRSVPMPDPRLVEQSHTVAFPTPSRGSGSASGFRTPGSRPSGSEVVAGLQTRPGQTGVASRRSAAVLVAVAGLAAAGAGTWWFWPVESPPAATSPAPTSTPAASPPAAQPVLPPPSTPVGVASDPGNEVWRRLFENDREAVLRLLKAAPAGADGSAAPLASEVLAAVKKTVTEARATAVSTPGAVPSEVFRSGEARRTEATRLEGKRDPIGAIGMLWRAGDSYVQAVTSSRSSPPAIVESQPDARESAAVTPPPPAPAPTPAPAPAPVVTPPAQVQTLPADPSPRPSASPPVAERVPTATETPQPSPEQGVMEALDRFRAAHEARDADQLTPVFPTMPRDQVEALRKTFQGVRAYVFEIRDPRIQVKGDDAVVEATLVRRLTPIVGGNPLPFQGPATFRLRRAGRNWVLTQFDAR
jgi:eukaryotic-like serine/threonine-protein kinase